MMCYKFENLMLAVILAGTVVGCGDAEDKKTAPATTPVAPAAPASVGEPAPAAVTAPPPPSGQVTAPPSGAAAGTAPAAVAEVPSKDALEAVTHAVQSFFIQKERAPKNLEELISAGFLRKLPTPPPGKKYVYDPERANIILADQ
jgi:hypothetical protein